MNFDSVIQTTVELPDRAVLHRNSRDEILGFSLDGTSYRIWTAIESEDGTVMDGAALAARGVGLAYDEAVTEDLVAL